MGETGKRYRSQRDRDHDSGNNGGNKNQKRRVNDRDDRGGGGDEVVVYRILCPVGVIGSVIGKSGKVINSIRQDSRAKVKVVDPFPGAKDRVITIYSYVRDKEEVDVDDEFSSDREPLCTAQDALFKVHSTISNALAAAGESEKRRREKEECQCLSRSCGISFSMSIWWDFKSSTLSTALGLMPPTLFSPKSQGLLFAKSKLVSSGDALVFHSRRDRSMQ